MRTSPADRFATAAIFALAVAARAGAVLVLQSHTVPRSTYEHGEIAENLLAGRGFSTTFLGAFGPTSQQAPVYPFIVAAAYALGGAATPRSLLILELGQALLGGVLAVGVVRLAAILAPSSRPAHAIAGLIAALHPTLVYAATHVQAAGLVATLLVWLFVAAERTAESLSSRGAAVVGLLAGLLVLTDPILVLAAPAVFLSFARPPVPWSTRLRLTTITAASAIAVISPWIIRNALVHNEFVFVKSTFGYAFWQGNCVSSQGTDKVVRPSVDEPLHRPIHGLAQWNRALWEARHEAGYIDDIALSTRDKHALAQKTEPERSRVLMRRALDDLRAEPGRYVHLCIKRLQYFLLFDETNPKTRSRLYRVPHIVLSALAVAGLARAGRAARRRFVPGIMLFVLLTAFHALTITSARFHIPLEPIMSIWAAHAIACPALPSTMARPAQAAKRAFKTGMRVHDSHPAAPNTNTARSSSQTSAAGLTANN